MPTASPLRTVLTMSTDWEMVESGPADAVRTVLFLPGGMCSARSWAEVTAEPALAGIRLLAVTLPGMAGAPSPEDYSMEHYARITAELAEREGVDVVVGFSMGANVAYEMVVSGAFAGPVVLLSLSLSTAGEPLFFRAMIRLGSVLGTLPAAVMKKGVGPMIKKAPIPAGRQAELIADFALNRTTDMRAALHAYLKWMHRDDDPARRLCMATVPAWVVHAEKHGDGGLSAHERTVFEACPQVRLVTLPGNVFFIPNERPDRVADLVVEALAAL